MISSYIAPFTSAFIIPIADVKRPRVEIATNGASSSADSLNVSGELADEVERQLLAAGGGAGDGAGTVIRYRFIGGGYGSQGAEDTVFVDGYTFPCDFVVPFIWLVN